MIFGMLLTSSNYNDTEEKVSEHSEIAIRNAHRTSLLLVAAPLQWEIRRTRWVVNKPASISTRVNMADGKR